MIIVEVIQMKFIYSAWSLAIAYQFVRMLSLRSLRCMYELIWI